MHDVMVIGAGPAGNIAALRLAGLGYRVAVLDWRHRIGDKLCTGIIGTECVERFPPDEAHVYRRASSAVVVSPAGKRYRVARQDVQAYIIDRVAYVDSLARQAIEAGADYELGRRVEDIEVSDRGVTALTTGESGPRRYLAKMVIIASGFGSPLLKMVGLRNGVGDHVVGCQAEVSADGLEDTEVHLGEEIAPGSFGWLVPLTESRALIGTISHRRQSGQMEEFLRTQQAKGKVKEVISKPRRWGIPLKPLRKTYGNRALVVGDAAGLAKPTTGGGIYYALLSGDLAAGAAHEALMAGDLSANSLESYQRGWKAVFGAELRTGRHARMLYEALRDRQVERLLSVLLSPEIREELLTSREFSFDWHSGIITKAVRHRGLGPVFRSFGPMVVPLLVRLGGARLF